MCGFFGRAIARMAASGCVLLGVLVGTLTLTGCASVPDLNPVVDTAHARPKFVGPHGPLSVAESKAIVAKLDRDEHGNTDVLQRHLALEAALSEIPIDIANTVQVLSNGEAALSALLDAMESATHHINLEYYTIEDIDDHGRKVSDILLRKLQQGVQVNIIYDSIGSSDTPNAFFDTLKQAGAQLVDFNPANPLKAKGAYKPNDRDHRKILIADGKVAIIGGVNLSKVYLSGPGSRAPKDQPPEAWKDTDIRIAGPAVAELQKLFLSDWKSQKGPGLDESGFFPHLDAEGAEIVHILGSDPGKAIPPYYASLLSAVRNADTRVWIAAAYFVPTRQEVRDLIDAAKRGVDVRLLLPGKTDSAMAKNAGQAHYSALLKHGIKIYETDNTVVHSKTAVIDSVWSVVGSSNFDHRSVLFNSEVDGVVLGRDAARELERVFEADLASARQIDPEKWRHRPLGPRVKEFVFNIWQDML